MINTNIIRNRVEISSDTGFIHKIGTNTYFKKGIIIDTLENYEEVDEVPKYTEEEYKEKVRELIKRKYTVEDEIALLANVNSPLVASEAKVEEYSAEYLDYQVYREECKTKAKEILNNGKED